MRRIGIATVLGALLAAAPVRAQFLVGPIGGPVITGGGFGLNFQGRRGGLSFFAGRAPVFGYGGFPFGAPYGFGFGPPWISSTTIIVPPPVVVVQPIIVAPPVVVPPGPAPVRVDDRIPDPERFIVIRPNMPNAVPPVAPPVRVAKEPNPAPPLPPPARVGKEPNPVLPRLPPARVAKMPKEVDLGIAPGPLPMARPPAANPRREADLLIETGKTAFARAEFGRAMETFRQAATVLPDDPTVCFLLAQAQFAVGKYDEAAAGIVAGLKRQPDWPLSPFKSRALYRTIPGAFDAHLRDLRDALAADPDDPRLLLLLGVQLWFDDKRDEARPLFEKAARRAIDPAPAEAFLKVKK